METVFKKTANESGKVCDAIVVVYLRGLHSGSLHRQQNAIDCDAPPVSQTVPRLGKLVFRARNGANRVSMECASRNANDEMRITMGSGSVPLCLLRQFLQILRG